MKAVKIFLATLGVALILFTLWSAKINDASYDLKAIHSINTYYQKDIAILQNAAKSFNALCTAGKTQTYQDSVQITLGYKNLRNAYKSIEFLIEYVDKEAIDQKINGAPLLKVEKKVADRHILKPKGLQVIDELMVEARTLETQKELAYQAGLLNDNIAQLAPYLKSIKLNERQFFEAVRMGIVRVSTLGITGFDTPGTLQGVRDAHTFLQSIKKYTTPFRLELKNVNKQELYTAFVQVVDQGLQQTTEGDFDTFDRLDFITQTAQPLYRLIQEKHMALGYETIAEVSRYLPAVNFDSQSLFGKDFLDPFYYVSMRKDSTFTAQKNLGKKLFNDPLLSATGTMSCATCHHPERAFTENRAISLGSGGILLQRNTMTLNYAVFAKGFFHDLRVNRLEDQFEHVVVHKGEYDTDYETMVQKLARSNEYQYAFAKAYPAQKQAISSQNIDYALTAYVMSLNDWDSDFDQFLAGDEQRLSEQQKRGFNLFAGKAACATCHFLPTFNGTVPPTYTESETEVLGVPEHKDTPTVMDDDLGRMANGKMSELVPHYKNSFKTPTLRNVALTSPYMHNGVYDTLEEVMGFYNKGGGAGQGMDAPHQTLAPNALELSDSEINDIILFMESLTDKQYQEEVLN